MSRHPVLSAIKQDGKRLTEGSVDLSEQDAAALMAAGVVGPASDPDDVTTPEALFAAKVLEHVRSLDPDDFKVDGGLRAPALRAATEALGFEPTEDQVAAARAVITDGQDD